MFVLFSEIFLIVHKYSSHQIVSQESGFFTLHCIPWVDMDFYSFSPKFYLNINEHKHIMKVTSEKKKIVYLFKNLQIGKQINSMII